MNLEKIIVKPVLTEKSTIETEKFNRYSFIVNNRANKNQIKNAIEKLFNVKVLSVNTTTKPGKLKRVGKFLAKRPMSKKAYVQIQAGQKIELFKGV